MKNKQSNTHPILFIGFALFAISSASSLFSDGNTKSILMITLYSLAIFCLTFGIVKTIKMRRNADKIDMDDTELYEK